MLQTAPDCPVKVCTTHFTVSPRTYSYELNVASDYLRLYNQKILASVDSFVEDQPRLVLDLLMKRITEPSDGVIQNIALQTAFIPNETIGPVRKAK